MRRGPRIGRASLDVRPSNCRAGLHDWSQLERGNAKGDVNRYRAFDRYWLQRHRPTRATNKHIRTNAKPKANIARGPDVFSGKRSGLDTGGRCEYGPAEYATSANTDIEPYRVERALVGLRHLRRVRYKTALHRLVASYNETNAWINLASEHAYLRPRVRCLSRRWRGEKPCKS